MTLSCEQLKSLLDYDPHTGVFTRCIDVAKYKAGENAGTKSKYIQIGVNGTVYTAQRLAWLFMTGEWPEGQVDHRNQDKHDNRWENLRLATNAQNHQNRDTPNKQNSSRLLGASLHKRTGKYTSQIMVDGKKIHLGYFATAEEAAAAYTTAKADLHPFAEAFQQ